RHHHTPPGLLSPPGPNRPGTPWRQCMNPLRVLMMMATLLASAAVANAQSLPMALLQLAHEQNSQRGPESVCPVAEQANWYSQALQHGAAAWQRVRTMYLASGQSAQCGEPACALAKPGVCKDAASCGAGGVGSAKGLQIQVYTTGNGTFLIGGLK